MRYRHTPKYQMLLQRTLNDYARTSGISESEIVSESEANLGCSKSTLNRFRRGNLTIAMPQNLTDVQKEAYLNSTIERAAGSFLNPADAKALWEYLDEKNCFEQLFDADALQKRDSLPISDVADAMHCFFGVHKSSNRKFVSAGLEGSFCCYKPSFRREGFTVKAIMTFSCVGEDYFTVKEEQLTSGAFELDQANIVEKSEGFAFVKSNRVWVFLRDKETEQPRIFCFHKPKYAHLDRDGVSAPQSDIGNETISFLYGYLVEGAKGNENNAFSYNAVLISEHVERRIWNQMHLDSPTPKPFSMQQQKEVIPTGTTQKELYSEQLKGVNAHVPLEVLDYLEKGTTNGD